MLHTEPTQHSLTHTQIQSVTTRPKACATGARSTRTHILNLSSCFLCCSNPTWHRCHGKPCVPLLKMCTYTLNLKHTDTLREMEPLVPARLPTKPKMLVYDFTIRHLGPLHWDKAANTEKYSYFEYQLLVVCGEKIIPHKFWEKKPIR